jgi:EAL domain-containing protein (putative c-di-GMP-specific phosphodiesterase class I)
MTTPSLLDQLLAPGGVSIVFQPIVEARNRTARVHSVECLARGPSGTHAESPVVLFEYVRRRREEPAVDRACLLKCLEQARGLPPFLRLSLNVHATTLSRDPEFPQFVASTAEAAGISPCRITMEIVENAPPHDGPAFLRALSGLRSFGMRIALDDVGLGHSNYKMIVDTRPDYFKIDRFFVRNVHEDSYRMAVLESVGKLAERVGARVVAEGVETLSELDAVKSCGIDLIQGYLFSRPLSASALQAHRLFVSEDGSADHEGPRSGVRESNKVFADEDAAGRAKRPTAKT